MAPVIKHLNSGKKDIRVLKSLRGLFAECGGELKPVILRKIRVYRDVSFFPVGKILY